MVRARAPRCEKQRYVKWTGSRRARFLEVLALTANVSEAARVAGPRLAGAYKLRARDPEFAAAWDAAMDQAMDDLLGVVFDQARNGTVRTISDQGRPIRTIHSFEPRTAIRLLLMYRPSLYPALRPSPQVRDREDEVARAISRIVRCEADTATETGADTNTDTGAAGDGRDPAPAC